MFDPPLASGAWSEVGVHRYTWLGVGDFVLDHEPARGNYTLWRLDRAAQAEENLGALGWELSGAECAELEAAAKKVPKKATQNIFQTD